jgi:hypothetical protein
MLEQVEAGQQIERLKMDVLQAIRYISKAWEEITAKTIRQCWQHTGILPESINADLQNPSDDVYAINDSVLDEICRALENLNLSESMEVEEFLAVPEEDVVYEISDDDQIITELADIFKEENSNNLDDADDSTEIAAISASAALKGLETVQAFLIQQENTNEHLKFTNILERYIREKKASLMQQSSIDQYFNKLQH